MGSCRSIKSGIENISTRFLTIAEYLEQPNKLLEDGFEKVLGGLKDYLDASATGMLDGLGIDAFMNMVKRYPDTFISAQNVIKGREDDLDAWMEYAWYFGEHVFVDGILETAASQINGIFENDLLILLRLSENASSELT